MAKKCHFFICIQNLKRQEAMNMITVSFKEYENAKLEVIKGVDWSEDTINPNQYGMNSKTYSTT